MQVQMDGTGEGRIAIIKETIQLGESKASKGTMTEINVTRIGRWWRSVSHFFWTGFGVLWVLFEIILLVRNGNKVGNWIMLGVGITMTVISLMPVKCANCSTPNPFEIIWKAAYEHKHFTCSMCGARYELPLWTRMVLNATVYGYGFISLASGCNSYTLNTKWIIPDYMDVATHGFVIAATLSMLVVCLSQYERLDTA